MLTMYPGMVNSPITELAAAIDDVQTTITVVDGTKLPDAPNLAIIGRGEDAETILYTEKTGNVLSGVVRGFQGVAKAWGQGARIARFFTEYDQRAMMQNIQENADNLAAHLNDKLQDGVHGLSTTSNLTLYVDPVNGDDSNDGLTPETAFKSIQKAIDSVPKIVNHDVRIYLEDGTHDAGVVYLQGFIGGKGALHIQGLSSVRSNVIVKGYFDALNNTAPLTFSYFTLQDFNEYGLRLRNCTSINVNNAIVNGNGLVHPNTRLGVASLDSSVVIHNVKFINFQQSTAWNRGAIFSGQGARVSTYSCEFEDVDTAFFADYGIISGDGGSFSFTNVNRVIGERYGGKVFIET